MAYLSDIIADAVWLKESTYRGIGTLQDYDSCFTITAQVTQGIPHEAIQVTDGVKAYIAGRDYVGCMLSVCRLPSLIRNRLVGLGIDDPRVPSISLTPHMSPSGFSSAVEPQLSFGGPANPKYRSCFPSILIAV